MNVIKYFLLLIDELYGPEMSECIISNIFVAFGVFPPCDFLDILATLHSMHLGVFIWCKLRYLFMFSR